MTTPTDRPRVILHVGIRKTGSSALQLAFARNRELLAEHGIVYPSDPSLPRMEVRASRGFVTSGNAATLRSYLLLDETPDGADLEKLLGEVLGPVRSEGGDSSVLFSSEFLCSSDMGRLATFAQACGELGYDVEAVGYVRNIVGHAVSSYIQQVKRKSYTAPFGTYIEPAEGNTYDPMLRSWVEGMRKVLGESAVTVFHYDSLRGDLVKHFFEEYLSIPGGDLAPEPEHTVNRSLTPSEVFLMRQINSQLDTRTAGRMVSDLLISAPPSLSERPFITRTDRARLVERFTDEVAWINANGIRGGTLELDSASIELHDEAPEDPPITPGEETLARVVAALANGNVRLQGKGRKGPRRAAKKAASTAAEKRPKPRRKFFRRK